MSEPIAAASEWRLRLQGVSKRFVVPETGGASARQPLKRTWEWAQRFAKGPVKPNEFTALQGIDLEVRAGECVGLLGPNGSGKSTLLQVACGILPPSTGKVEVRGRIAALLELGSGFDPEFTGRENVYLNAAILGLSRKQVKARFTEVEEFADIGPFIDQPVRTYSSGMLMRLAFAVQVLVEPEILIVDEALAVGDAAFQRKCFGRIERMRAAGMTILFVSHDISAVLNLCDRALLLYQGESLCQGPAKPVSELYEKLIHASPYHRPAVVEEIRQRAAQGLHENSDVEDTGEEVVTIGRPVVPDWQVNEPWLRSHSAQEYPSHGATISRPRLLDEQGREVNLLRRRGTYTFAYDVEFTDDAEQVNFAMLIKNKEGVHLGGCRTYPAHDRLAQVTRGTIKTVSFRFEALLNHGVYFLNAGIEGTVNGETTYLHRIVDVVAFQVVAESATLTTAIVDFRFEPAVADAGVAEARG